MKVLLGVIVAVRVGEGVKVLVGVGVNVWVGVGVKVLVGVRVEVWIDVGVKDPNRTGGIVLVGEAVDVCVGVFVLVGVDVGVWVGLIVSTNFTGGFTPPGREESIVPTGFAGATNVFRDFPSSGMNRIQPWLLATSIVPTAVTLITDRSTTFVTRAAPDRIPCRILE